MPLAVDVNLDAADDEVTSVGQHRIDLHSQFGRHPRVVVIAESKELTHRLLDPGVASASQARGVSVGGEYHATLARVLQAGELFDKAMVYGSLVEDDNDFNWAGMVLIVDCADGLSEQLWPISRRNDHTGRGMVFHGYS
jgi:hypothetical protein